jgi:nitrogen fixation NifU-like protein
VELRALIRSHELRPGAEDRLGDAFALADSGRYPLRGTCALLAWHALEEALGGFVSRARTSPRPRSDP